MSNRGGNIFLLGSSHELAPLEIRDRIAVGKDRLDSIYEGFRQVSGVEECLVLNTCNRIELYSVSHDPDLPALMEAFFCDFQSFDQTQFQQYKVCKDGVDVVRHIFAVSSGIDSQMVGETEILGQVKNSYSDAVKKEVVGPLLHRTFQKSFQAAKWVRSHTRIGRGQVSIGNVAVDLANRIFGDLGSCHILIVGTGEVGQKTAKALKRRGVGAITVSSRTLDHADALAREVGGQTILYENYQVALGQFDIVICSTAAADFVLSADQVEAAMQKRPDRPLFLIDLAVPRDIDDKAAEVPNVFLYDLDDLSEIANRNLESRKAEIDKCRHILDAKAEHFWQSLQPPQSPQSIEQSTH